MDRVQNMQTIEKEILNLRAKYLSKGFEEVWIGFPQEDFISLDKVLIPERLRGEGLGTEFMTDLIDLADKYSLTIGLYPSSDYGSTLSRLIKFYKKFGFVSNTYPNKNRDLRFSYTMIRPTKKVVQKEYTDLVGRLLIEAFAYNNVKSSNLKRIGYDPKTAVLEIEFLSGGKYIYNDVPKIIFTNLKKAASKGKYFWRKIRNFFDYERIK